MIDWHDLTNAYNKQKQANLSTYDMLDYLYRLTGSMDKVGNYLGVSSHAVRREMDRLHVPRVRKTPEFFQSFAKSLDKMPDKEFLLFTRKELAERLGCSISTINHHLFITGRRCKPDETTPEIYKRRFAEWKAKVLAGPAD